MALAEAFAPFIRGLLGKPGIVRALGGREDAEQSIHFALIKAAGNARPGPHIAHEVTRDAWDSLKRLVRRNAAQASLTVELEDKHGLHQEAEESAVAHLDAAVANGLITERDRKAIELHYLEGLTIKETALRLGENYKTLQRQLLRAVERLGGAAKQIAHGRKPRD
jgi:RNA polymerase sigma factor (sigma-70 family)